MYCKLTISPRYLGWCNNVNYEQVLINVIIRVTTYVLEIIKSPGFCPVDTGDLRDGHHMVISGVEGRIICDVAYCLDVIYGHNVTGIRTERQRKWFFANLRSGTLSVKGVNYVAGNNYPLRAFIEVIRSGMVIRIMNEELERVLHG